MQRPDIDAIESRCNAATPGPWYLKGGGWFSNLPINFIEQPYYLMEWIPYSEGDAGYTKKQKVSDANFIAHSRQDIQDLLSYCRELERERDELRMRIAELEDTETGISFSTPDDYDPDFK